MSSASQTGEHCLDWVTPSTIKNFIKYLEGFFRTTNVTKQARIWHGNFSYSLIPNTAIRNFHNMSSVTSIDTGDCYVCIFDDNQYQGNYQIIGPGEKVQVNHCASVVVCTQKFSVDSVRHNARPPEGCWELDGPKYVMHFSSAYRYV